MNMLNLLFYLIKSRILSAFIGWCKAQEIYEYHCQVFMAYIDCEHTAIWSHKRISLACDCPNTQ
jgi:hypothetical protein